MHGIHYRPRDDLSGFSLTEKLDGLRIESRYGKAWSKSGGPLRLPDQLAQALKALPDLDAELYAGPGKRPALAGLAQSVRQDPPWPIDTGLYIFDSAEPLPAILPQGVHLVPAFGRAESTAAALRLASAVISAGGEGIMARAAGLPWTSARLPGLVKIKARSLAQVKVT